MKVITYNINGIRSALRKDFASWVQQTGADIICLQEVRAEAHQVEMSRFEEMGYHVFMHSAEKKGYSGVAILTRLLPEYVAYGCGIGRYDSEGRVIRADFDHLSVISVYMPSGSSGEGRQQFKFEWLDDFYHYINELKKKIPHLIVSGDYNICHQAIDLHNPVANRNSSGFLPREREWMGRLIGNGFIDTFRFFNQQPHHYTWWSNRPGCRAKNLGWRIDYHLATDALKDRLKSSTILNQVCHSDHCPVLLELD